MSESRVAEERGGASGVDVSKACWSTFQQAAISCKRKGADSSSRSTAARSPAHLFRHISQGYNLLERTSDATLLAGDKDARGNDGILTFALEQSLLVDAFKQLLARIRNALGQADDVAHGTNISVGRLQVATATLIFSHASGGHLECFGVTSVSILE